MVEAVFLEEEALGLFRVGVPAAPQHHHVAARAEAAALGMVDQDHLHVRIRPPAQQSFAHRRAHGGGQRVNRLGAVEADSADSPLDTDQDVVSHEPSPHRGEGRVRG